MKAIKEVKWRYILMEDAADLYLTFMSGGVFEIDFCVKLSAAEIKSIESDSQAIDSIISGLLADREELRRRRILPSKWPPNN